MPDIITKDIVQANNPDLVIQDEVYRPVVGYETRYLISNYGNIVTLDNRMRGRKLTIKVSGNGYSMVSLYKEGVCNSTTIHRLVAQAFIPLVDGKGVVNHKDGNKLNNYVENLEWCTQSENRIHAISTGLSVPNTEAFIEAGYVVSCKPVLIEETGEVFESCAECDRTKGYSREYTSHIIADCSGYSSNVGFHFKLISREEYLAVQNGTLKFEPKTFDIADTLHKGTKHSSKCVRIVETGECFASAVECDRKYDLVKGATSDTLKRKDKYYGKMDWHIERITKEEYIAWTKNPVIKEHTPNILDQGNLMRCRGGYCVKVVETGECFPTAKSCDEALHLPKNFTSTTIKYYDGYKPNKIPYHFIKIPVSEYEAYVNEHSAQILKSTSI